MNSITQNNEEAYFLLEKANKLFDDFNSDQVIAFDLEEDFYLVIYDSLTRDFITMKAENYRQDINALPELLEMAEENENGFLSAAAIDNVLNIIEDKILSGENTQFFDAH
jgi:hypothetical protein